MAQLRVLFVEDSEQDRLIIEKMISEINAFYTVEIDDAFFMMHYVSSIEEVKSFLTEQRCNLILLDLSLRDSQGLDTLRDIQDIIDSIPVVILTNINDYNMAIQSLQKGVQDYLVKGDITTDMLFRAMRYAQERHKLLLDVHALAIIDELTGVYNRRGFLQFAEHTRRIAKRRDLKLLMIFIDIDNMKGINDSYGHIEGDHAIQETAHILSVCFRESDVIARVGGDEFVVLGLDISQNNIAILDRLSSIIAYHNLNEQRPYQLSLSYGVKSFDPQRQENMAGVIEQADGVMYQQKKSKE